MYRKQGKITSLALLEQLKDQVTEALNRGE